MATAILVLLFTASIGRVVAAQRPGSHAATLGGLMLVSGLVGLGFTLARSAG